MYALGSDINMSSEYVIQIITYVIETVAYVIEWMRLERCVYVIKICHTNYRICHRNSGICHGMPALATDVNMSSGYVIQIIVCVIETVVYVIECMRLGQTSICHQDMSHKLSHDICCHDPY